jgi:hypothetical protein
MRLCTALLACLALVACGGGTSTPDEHLSAGFRALGSKDFVTAQSEFEGALAQLDAGDPRYLEAQLGWIEALAATDGARARDEFLKLAGDPNAAIGVNEYAKIGNALGNAGQLTEAIDVAEAARARYPDEKKLDALIASLGRKAEQSSDPAQLRALQGLGYVGSD